MDNIIIEKMKEEDIQQVAKILIDSWKIAYKDIIDKTFLQSLTLEEKIQKLKEEYKIKEYTIARNKNTNEIVGVTRFGKRLDELDRFTEYDGEIYALYVKPGLLRKKIGSKLLLYAKEKLKEQGNHKMIIWCLKENQPSRMFYEGMGGILLGEKMRNIGGKDYPLVGYGYEI